jgi:hypothetical protein
MQKGWAGRKGYAKYMGYIPMSYGSTEKRKIKEKEDRNFFQTRLDEFPPAQSIKLPCVS